MTPTTNDRKSGLKWRLHSGPEETRDWTGTAEVPEEESVAALGDGAAKTDPIALSALVTCKLWLHAAVENAR